MALVPDPKPLTRLTNLVSKILITDFGAIGFYEPTRGGGGKRPQPPPPLHPCPSLWKDGKFPPNGAGQQPLILIWGNTVRCKLFNLYICKTPVLGLYMDTTGKRFFEFCFCPKLPARVHRYVWFVILWTPFLAFCKAALFFHDIPIFSYGRLWRSHKLKMHFHISGNECT